MSSWKGYDDNHFLLLIYKLSEKHFGDYYNHHLSHTLEKNLANEQDFFKLVWQIVEDRIEIFRNKDPFSRKHATYVSNIEKLQKFQIYLKSIDIWNARPSNIVVAEKDALIQQLLDKNEKLQVLVAESKEFDVVEKVSIHEDYFYSFLDLLIQMRQLNVPSKDRKILDCDYKSPYCKLLSKYFLNGDKPISIETMNNYFVNKVDTTIKGTKIKPKHHIFQILPVKPIQ